MHIFLLSRATKSMQHFCMQNSEDFSIFSEQEFKKVRKQKSNMKLSRKAWEDTSAFNDFS